MSNGGWCGGTRQSHSILFASGCVYNFFNIPLHGGRSETLWKKSGLMPACGGCMGILFSHIGTCEDVLFIPQDIRS